jgi:hypothetical protein
MQTAQSKQVQYAVWNRRVLIDKTKPLSLGNCRIEEADIEDIEEARRKAKRMVLLAVSLADRLVESGPWFPIYHSGYHYRDAQIAVWEKKYEEAQEAYIHALHGLEYWCYNYTLPDGDDNGSCYIVDNSVYNEQLKTKLEPITDPFYQNWPRMAY